ncbi:MAG: S41 family peptidase [Bacteroidota bacterium]
MIKKLLLPLFAIFFSLTLFISCSDDDGPIDRPDPPAELSEDKEVQNFIWQGLNLWYFWQESVPNLADDKFATDDEYVNFINNSSEPEDFFESLIYNRSSVDFWSWIVDDYVELEKLFQGVSMHNGVEFGLVGISQSNDIFGYVRYVLPDTNAVSTQIKRGDIFTHVNGTKLTRDNYRDLLFSGNDSYTLSLAKIENNTIIPTGVDVELTKSEYTENPVFLAKTFEESGKKIGYLMYNGFTSSFDQDLNNAFLQFKNEGVTDLVLDFRYNPGGSVQSAIYLAGMVTGQFKGELFTKERWNSKLQAEFEANYPDWLVNNFTDAIVKKDSNGNVILNEDLNSLNLSNVHIIVTHSSASASELIINGLNPYINVKLIGEQTVGKYVASITLYDSDNFGREGANPDHSYAMQPIVLEEINKLGENDKDGFEPHIPISEDFENMGVLGERNEPLLQVAINDILGIAPKMIPGKRSDYDNISNSKLHSKLSDNMYIEKSEITKYINREFLDKN